jgi:guanosine-3',5'-bis(diphosphate) 3'-pyrophosphohydrolase
MAAVPNAMPELPALFAALGFAAHKHAGQLRKSADMSPYINHPIAVAGIPGSVAIESRATRESCCVQIKAGRRRLTGRQARRPNAEPGATGLAPFGFARRPPRSALHSSSRRPVSTSSHALPVAGALQTWLAIQWQQTLARDGGISDAATLAAALLHDTLEDTDTTELELTRHFGVLVAAIVVELTDDMTLPKAERKSRQILLAREYSRPARLVRIADKIANIRDVTHNPPAHWSAGRRLNYLHWAAQVVASMRGTHAALERLFDADLAHGLAVLGALAETATSDSPRIPLPLQDRS